MNFRRILGFFIVGYAFSYSIIAEEPVQLVEGNEVARAFGYNGNLRLEELTASAKFRNQGTLWSANFLSADETIPVTSIVLAKGGTELTDVFKQKCSVASQQQIRLPDGRMMPPLASHLRLTDGAEGFSYFVGFGPGGTSYAAGVTTPDGKYDIVIGVGVSADEPAIEKGQPPSTGSPSPGTTATFTGTPESALRTLYPTIVSNARVKLAEPTSTVSASPGKQSTTSPTPSHSRK